MQISARRHKGLACGAVLLASSLGVPRASMAAAVQQSTAQAAFEECKALFKMKLWGQSIARCDEAVRLDPTLPDPYFFLGFAHGALVEQGAPTSAASDDPRMREHRRKTIENLKMFLALTRGDTDPLRTLRPMALGGLLRIYIAGDDTDEAALEYANELARQPSLARGDVLVLAAVYSRHARPALAETLWKRQLAADPSDAQACKSLVELYRAPVWNGQQRLDDSMATLERCLAQSPTDSMGQYTLATYLWNKGYRDLTLTDEQRLDCAERGLNHINQALSLEKDFWEAMLFKGLLLRLKASNLASDPGLRQRLLDEASSLQARALSAKAAGVPPHPGLAPAPDQQQPAPAPQTPPEGVVGGVVGGVPGGMVGGVVGSRPEGAIRVGGDIREPKKLKDVPPVYPDIAKKARVQGEVTLECTIGLEGNVLTVQVLRGIPLLDGAALDAVRQWMYTPTLLNGIPVPVIMTVTVSFKLSEVSPAS